MKTIKLHGWLGKEFKDSFTLDIQNPAEAIRALCNIVPGFRKAMEQDDQGFRLWINEDNITPETIAFPFSSKEVFHIVPVISGAKAGIGQILLGVALVALAFATMGTSTFMTTEFITGMSLTSLAFSVGLSLVLGGIVSLLFKPPKPGNNEKANNTPSYSFNGPVNTVQQGGCVPVCYGELIIGSYVVSSGVYTEDFVV